MEGGSTDEAALTDKSDTEIINECEQEMLLMTGTVNVDQQIDPKLPEKRSREKSEDSSEESFITVSRRRPKKLFRSEPNGNLGTHIVELNKRYERNNDAVGENDNVTNNSFEICLTSLQVLPKQMALAKWLRSGNIQNIIRIKYKSPYKVFVQFDDKKQAEKLLNFPKNKDLDIRAQFTDEVDLSYGLIKGVESEMTDKEMIDTFSTSCEIVSVRRLKRMNEEGKWIDSETVRLGFKTQILPEYVYAYGCRFRVEKYVFPVTQCSGCWKFGHHKKFCPINKNLCPKCGKEHNNCETETFTCLNCKGPHMAINKTCPFFIKEKRIRVLMSLGNTTYKNALAMYIQEKRENIKQFSREIENESSNKEQRFINADVSRPTNINSNEKLTGERAENYIEQVMDDEPDILEERQEDYVTAASKKSDKNQKKVSHNSNKKNNKNLHGNNNMSVSTESLEVNQNQEEEKRSTKEKKIQWKRIWRSIMEIVFSAEKDLMAKMVSMLKVICEEIKLFLLGSFMDREVLHSYLFKHNG